MRHYHHNEHYSRPEDDAYSEDNFDVDDVVEELEKLQEEIKTKRNRRPNREARKAIEDYLEKKRRKVEEGDPFEEEFLDE